MTRLICIIFAVYSVLMAYCMGQSVGTTSRADVFAEVSFSDAARMGQDESDELLDWIVCRHGEVKRDQSLPGSPVISVKMPVDLRSSRVIQDEDLRKLSALTHLQCLEFGFADISNAGLREINRLKNLEVLKMSNGTLRELDVGELAGLKKLRVLQMSGLKSADFRKLSTFANLREVDTFSMRMTSEDAKELTCISNLETLTIYSINGAAILKELPKLKKLRRLTMSLMISPGEQPLVPLGNSHNIEFLHVTVSCPRQELSFADLKALVGLTGLKSLVLENNPMTDESIRELASCKALRSLSILNCGKGSSRNAIWFYGHPLAGDNLRDFAQLNELDLSNSRVKANGLAELASLKQLTSLKLTRDTTDSVLKRLAILDQLEILDLKDAMVTDMGVMSLRNLKKMKQLNLEGTRVTDVGLKALIVLNDLESLDLRKTKVTELGLNELVVLTKLKALRIDPDETLLAALVAQKKMLHILVQARGLTGKMAADADDVQILDFRASNLTDSGLKHLTIFRNLRALDLSETLVTDAGLDEIMKFPKLLSVNLRGCSVTDAGVRKLGRLKRLRDLDLSETRITNTAISEIALLENLESLEVESTNITDVGIRDLSSLKRLEALNVRETRISDSALRILARCKKLRFLDVATGISNAATKGTTDAAVRELRAALPACRIP